MKKGSSFNSRFRFLDSESFGISFQTVLVFLFLIHFLFLTWYFGVDYAPRISWIPFDAPFSREHSFGVHNFSDYLQIWNLAKANSWDSNNIYPPFAVFIIKLFTWTPYKPTIILFLIIMASGTLLPIICGSKNRNVSARLILVLILGAFSVPFISTLDRGNLIGMLPAIFYLYFFLREERKVLGAIFLGIASAIKVYPLIFLFFLPKLDRLKTVAISFGTFLVLNLSTSLIWGNPIDVAKKILHAQKNFSSLNIAGDSMNFSASSICLNISNLVFGSDSKLSLFIHSYPVMISLFVFLILLVEAHKGHKAIYPITFPFLGLYALQLIPIISYTYTRWWGLVVIGLLINNRFMANQRNSKYESFIWTIVLLNIALLNVNEFSPISIFPTISFASVIIFCIYDVGKNAKIRYKIFK
jgi:Glycosyltransferase family 87